MSWLQTQQMSWLQTQEMSWLQTQQMSWLQTQQMSWLQTPHHVVAAKQHHVSLLHTEQLCGLAIAESMVLQQQKHWKQGNIQKCNQMIPNLSKWADFLLKSNQLA